MSNVLDDLVRTQHEADALRATLDDAIAILRDWEDYDPEDRECSWKERRDEFLAEHEEKGR